MELLRSPGLRSRRSEAGEAWVLRRVEEPQKGKSLRGSPQTVSVRICEWSLSHMWEADSPHRSRRPEAWGKTRLATLVAREDGADAGRHWWRTLSLGGWGRTNLPPAPEAFSLGLPAVQGAHVADIGREGQVVTFLAWRTRKERQRIYKIWK